nr:hypothetical protein ART_00103 [Achromobacter phage vB_Ade_ART]
MVLIRIESKEDHIMSKSIYEKRYLSSKQAQAAVDKEGMAEGSYEIRKEGKMYQVFAIEQAEPTVAMSARQEQDAAIKELQEAIPACKTLESTSLLAERLLSMGSKFNLSVAVFAALDEAIGARIMEIEGEEALTRAQVASAPGNKPGWVHASSVLKPTKLVWIIADEMYAEAQNAGKPMPSRKEVQAECVRRGIASGTARTQFQHWFKLHNENPERATIDPATGKIIPPAGK